MSDDFDKREWQERQAEQDAAYEKQRAKDEKTKARSARNAKRKIERLRAKLKEAGELSEWEDEFSESVTERLDKFGSAFADPEKGRSGDALSFAQKKVVSALNKKAKGEKSASSFKKNSDFKSKSKNSFTPRVRQIEDDMPEEDKIPETHRPDYIPDKPKRPFLRIVSNKDKP
ncbi:MAG: hypothetical protein ACSHXY_13190 [Alphaproteobacteria bacterium]